MLFGIPFIPEVVTYIPPDFGKIGQMGVIVHGAGLNLEYAEMDAETSGYGIVRREGFTELWK